MNVSLLIQQKTLRIETPRAFLPLVASSRYKCAHGGRGSGKSHFFAEHLIERAATEPLRAVCIREVQRSLDQSVKRLLEDKIEAFGLGSLFRCLDNRIEGATGSYIIFQGMQNHTAESIKSLEGYDVAWVEEAQSLSQRSLDLLRPTIRGERSEIWFSWNPKRTTDPVDTAFRNNDPPPGSTVVEVNYNDNPWFPDVLKTDMEWDRRRDPDKYQHIWLGGYLRNSEATVFRNWTEEAFETPPEARFYFGADWGFSVDPTVLVRLWIDGRTIYIDQEAYKVGCEIDNTPALFAGTDKHDPPRWANPSSSHGIPGALDWQITADSARPETISYVAKRGFRIVSAKKGAGSVQDGIEFLKSYDIKVHPRCRHCIDELTLYSYETDKLTGEVIPVLEDKKNHVIDALRYALESTRRAQPKTTVTPVLGLY